MTELESVDDVLAHYGVPGMKWGRRKASSGGSSSSGKPSWAVSPPKRAATVKEAQPKTKVARTGLLRRKVKPPKELSEDAIAFRAIRAKAKTKGVGALTNAELKTVTQRMNLMNSYANAFPKKKNPLVEMFLDNALSKDGEEKFSNYVAGPSPRSKSNAQKAQVIGVAISVASQLRKK